MTQSHDLVQTAGQLFMQGRFAEAAELYTRAQASDPDSADLLNNLAACQLEMGQYQNAKATSSKALERDPKHAFALTNRADAQRQLGEIFAAINDYSAALAHDPNNPVVLNKAGACLHLTRQHEQARQHFERALSLAPDFALARLNLGLLAISACDTEEAANLIRSSLDNPGLDRRSAHVARISLTILAEYRRLGPSLDLALTTHDPTPLHQAVQKTPETLLSRDADTLESLQSLALACNKLDVSDQDFCFQSSTQHLAFIEACALCGIEYDAKSIADRLTDKARGLDYSRDGDQHHLPGIYQACQQRRTITPGAQLAEAGESWVRYWHAQLLNGEARAYPGQFKCFPNAVNATFRIRTVAPELVCGTLRELMTRLGSTVRRGLPRAIFTWLALTQIHAFKDGNGRVARFVFNWELEQSGKTALVSFIDAKEQIKECTWQSLVNNTPEVLFKALREIHLQSDRRVADINHRLANIL